MEFSRPDHERRMHAVLRYIDANLAAPLSLALLAELAHFSPFHFHRLFAAWMDGETLGEYLSRRRLELAALRMWSQPRLSVLDAALSVGFASGEAFARAFKKRFGLAPTVWRVQVRQERNLGQVERKLDQAGQGMPFDNGNSSATPRALAMNVRLVERTETEISYLRYEGPLGPPVQQFWRHKVRPWLHQNGLQKQALFGVSMDDPGVSDPERCRYDAAAEVPPSFEPGPGRLRARLPGGLYAVLPYLGNAEQIGAAWTALLRDWLPESGWQLAARPCFEHYPVDAFVDEASGSFACEICIPVQAL